jgi:CDI immunity protein
MNEVAKGSWAAAYSNGEFVCIKTMSGYGGGTHSDPKGVEHYLDIQSGDEALGSAVSDAMARSRFVLSSPRTGSVYPPGLELDSELYDPKMVVGRYDAWKKSLMQRYGYGTQQALFKCMRHCSIEKQCVRMTISPSHHQSLERWGRTKGDGIEDVVISADSTPAEIGAALRLAFSRCTE